MADSDSLTFLFSCSSFVDRKKLKTKNDRTVCVRPRFSSPPPPPPACLIGSGRDVHRLRSHKEKKTRHHNCEWETKETRSALSFGRQSLNDRPSRRTFHSPLPPGAFPFFFCFLFFFVFISFGPVLVSGGRFRACSTRVFLFYFCFFLMAETSFSQCPIGRAPSVGRVGPFRF